MDVVDFANLLMFAEIEGELELIRLNSLRPGPRARWNSQHQQICISCEEPLCDCRKQMQKVRCVECQEAEDHHNIVIFGRRM